MVIFLEHVPCDLCGADKYKIRYRKPDNWLWLNQFEFPVVECIECGLVYVNPRPTPDSMNSYYPEGYHDNRDTEGHLKRYSVQAEFLPKLTNEKVLDIGCARGDFLKYLKKIYPDIKPHGIDFYSDKVNSNEFTFIKSSLPDAQLPDSEFDIITAWAVFEHLHQPGIYFKEVSRILKKGGKFIFLVTNSESLYGKKANLEDIPRHTYHFSEKTLGKYAEKFGFRFEKCIYNDHIFDGKGLGTISSLIEIIVGLTWEKKYFKQISFIQRAGIFLGRKLDKIVFKNNWEAKRNKSGIMIANFIKE